MLMVARRRDGSVNHRRLSSGNQQPEAGRGCLQDAKKVTNTMMNKRADNQQGEKKEARAAQNARLQIR